MDTVVNVYTKKETKIKPKMNGKYQIPDDWIPDIVYYLASDDKNSIPYCAGNLKFYIFKETLERHFITAIEMGRLVGFELSFEISGDEKHVNFCTNEYDELTYLIVKYLIMPHIPQSIIPAKRFAVDYVEMSDFFKLLINVSRGNSDEAELPAYLNSIDFGCYILENI